MDSMRIATELEERWGADYFTEMCSGSEAGSYPRLLDFLYHSTLGLRVIKKKGGGPALEGLAGAALQEALEGLRVCVCVSMCVCMCVLMCVCVRVIKEKGGGPALEGLRLSVC